MKTKSKFWLLVALCLATASMVVAQVSTTGSLHGTVMDGTGAVVAGAKVTVRDDATGTLLETKTGPGGTFSFSNMNPGSYTVTVVMTGFKTAEYRAVKVVVGGQYNLQAKLELGEMQSTVVVEAGAEVLETIQTNVGTSITGRSITQLPFTSRDTLDLAVLMAGAQTTGRPRATSFLGLPKGAINITFDGINAQDNLLKSNDGFFTNIRPRVDSVEEFSISTAASGAEQGGEGAVQIRFETKRGGNQFHGGAWWYHRNDKFNSNYYFNNIAGTEKQRQRLNQFGVKIGGPIVADKLFFFTSLDFYRNPESRSRTRTILTDEATSGIFRYAVSSIPASLPAWVTCTPGTPNTCAADLFALAAANGLPTAIDPIVGSMLASLNSVVNVPGVGQLAQPSLFQRSITFNNGGAGRRNFPDFRFDYNANANHSITGIYHYNYFASTPDFLNNVDVTFPVAPFNTNQGSQNSNRNQFVGAWRWNIGASKSNEVRVGMVSSPLVFRPDLNLDLYPQGSTNLGPIRFRPNLNLVTQPLIAFTPSRRNGAHFQLIETFSWSRGSHNINIGGNWTELAFKDFLGNSAVSNATVGLATQDPARPTFVAAANFPGSSTTDRNNIASLYGMLTGRVTGFTGVVYIDPETRQFTQGVPRLQRVGQTELGMYATDTWRLRPSLTVNYGLRWEIQKSPRDKNNMHFSVVGGSDAVAGRSGSLDRLFQTGLANNDPVTLALHGDGTWYNTDMNNFAPSVGLAWQPGFDNTWWKRVFGGPGKTVIRAAYSVSYTREGLQNYFTTTAVNGGFSGTLSAAGTNLNAPGQFIAGSVQLSSLSVPNVVSTPSSFSDSFTIDPQVSSRQIVVYNQDLKVPYVQSWSLGIQRELTPSTVLEVRYVGNHGTGLWRLHNVNEVNIFENGFLDEFMVARNNLQICRDNQVACRTAAGSSSASFASYANLGLPGQMPVPIITAAFTGNTAGSQTNANFANGDRIGQLDNGLAGSFAGTLSGTLSFWNNIQTAGLPANFWILNPDIRAGAFFFTNDSHSTYNGLQIEVRRRPTKGLQFNTNYTFSKSLSNNYADASNSFLNFFTLRDKGIDKGPSPWDLRHAFKAQLIYDLPFGPGKRWSSSHAWVNRIIEGWELNTITRWQSGRIFQVAGGLGGTVNGSDGGVELIGVTPSQVQDMLSLRKTPDGRVFWFPEELIGSDGRASTSFLRPCSTPGQFCQQLFLNGPQFFRADWSIVKRTRLNERINLEYRAEFLNAFNNQNFFVGGSAATTVPGISLQSTSFGRITDAYQDVSTTDDPGGRIIQMVLRLNF